MTARALRLACGTMLAVLGGCALVSDSQHAANLRQLDGHGAGETGAPGVDIDGDGVPADEDCDDGDPAKPTYDADCDGTRTEDDCDDEDASLNTLDADGDGNTSCDGDCDDGDATREALDVDADGFSTCEDDCDDTRDWLHPYDSDDDGTPDRCGYRDLSAGIAHVCAIGSGGQIVCWGDNTSGSLDAPEDGGFVALGAGGYTSCGVREDGTVACWGSSMADGQVVGFEPDGAFVDVAASGGAACALDRFGQLVCWGSSNATENGVTTPPEGTWTEVRVDSFSTGCALSTAGIIQCWGGSGLATVGSPFGSTEFASFDLGSQHICGISLTGEVDCVQQGTSDANLPEARGASGIRQLVTANVPPYPYETCLLTDFGAVECSFLDFPDGDYTHIDMSQQHEFACAITAQGHVVCECRSGTTYPACTPP